MLTRVRHPVDPRQRLTPVVPAERLTPAALVAAADGAVSVSVHLEMIAGRESLVPVASWPAMAPGSILPAVRQAVATVGRRRVACVRLTIRRPGEGERQVVFGIPRSEVLP